MKRMFFLILFLCAPLLRAEPATPPSPPPAKGTPPPRAQAPTPPPDFFGPEEEKEALDFIQIVAPFRLDNLKNLKQFNRAEYQERLMDVLNTKNRLEMVKRNDPDQYDSLIEETKLDQQSYKISEDFRKAGAADEKDRLRGQLKETLNQLFDIRERNKQGEVKHLEQELARLKSTMDERKKNKDQIVQSRLKDMLDEHDSLKW